MKSNQKTFASGKAKGRRGLSFCFWWWVCFLSCYPTRLTESLLSLVPMPLKQWIVNLQNRTPAIVLPVLRQVALVPLRKPSRKISQVHLTATARSVAELHFSKGVNYAVKLFSVDPPTDKILSNKCLVIFQIGIPCQCVIHICVIFTITNHICAIHFECVTISTLSNL